MRKTSPPKNHWRQSSLDDDLESIGWPPDRCHRRHWPRRHGAGAALGPAGETVIIGSRNEERAQQTAAAIQRRAGPDANVTGMENSAACAAADILMLTVPFEAQATLIKQLKPAMTDGSILIDATVPLAASVGGRASRTLGVWQGS